MEKTATDLTDLLGREFTTRSPEETFELGRALGERLKDSAVILLSGELGAGKTLFTKGIAAGLEIDPREVTSPSFTIINVLEGRLRLHHIDLYRLDTSATLSLGLEEIFEERGSVSVIEWAERLAQAPQEALRVEIKCLSDGEREIRITS